MLPEVGALEYLIIAVVALIVVGPKDLPMLLRRLGQFVAKLRGMASEFRASFDEMARQSELDDLRKEVEAMRKGQFLDMAGHDEMMKSVDDIQRSLDDVGVDFHQGPETYNYDAEVAAQTPPLTIGEGPKPAKKPRAPRAKPNGAAKPAAKPVAKATAKAKPAAKPAPKTAPPKTVAGRTPRPKKTAGADA
jgi:sec-independent protein translocase protein TatB